MLALWKWQLSIAKTDVLLFFVLLVPYVWLAVSAMDAFSLALMPVIYSLAHASRLALLKTNDFHLLLHTMPIARDTIVKCIFLFSLCVNGFVIACTLPIQLYFGFTHDNVSSYLLAFSVSISILLVTSAMLHYFVLTDEAYDLTMTTIMLTMLLTTIVVVILHTAVFFSPFYIGKYIVVPIVSLLFYFLMMFYTTREYERRPRY